MFDKKGECPCPDGERDEETGVVNGCNEGAITVYHPDVFILRNDAGFDAGDEKTTVIKVINPSDNS